MDIYQIIKKRKVELGIAEGDDDSDTMEVCDDCNIDCYEDTAHIPADAIDNTVMTDPPITGIDSMTGNEWT
jgi:hypothetical protein